MLDGGTYSVPLDIPVPTYVTGPETTPDGEFVFDLFGNLYKVTDSGREHVQTLHEHDRFDDPDDPDDGDAPFAWPSVGSYELDLLSLPPPIVNFQDWLRSWFARILFADIAHAQFGDPIFLGTISFTIEELQTEPDPVIIIPGILGSEQHNEEWVIDPILHTYDDLIATLDENGYTREVDLFTFPYNWRKSNVETALLLKEKIKEVKRVCDCDKVDLVAHSMGGLVARQYVQSADAYENDIDQLIFLGTPHLGAPKAYLMWEGGTTGNDWQDAPLDFLLAQEAKERGYPDLFSYVRNEPIQSVRELLPVYDYIFDGAQLRDYPTGYPTNEFLEVLNSNLDELTNSGIEIFAIRGELGQDGTIVGITALDPTPYLPKWEHGFPESILGSGDGTVPTVSGSFVNSNLMTKATNHRMLPTVAEGDVFEILTGESPVTLVNNPDILNLKLILIKILSPADLLVVAPDGSKIGKDFNGQEVNEILNAFYTGFDTDTEFITILNPLDGEYKIYTQGTGSGPYTVETSFISNATTSDASFTGNTAPGITSQLNLEVQGGAIPPDSLDVVVTFESTLTDIERIYELGWMSKKAHEKLREELGEAVEVKKGKTVVDKGELRDILKKLKKYRGKKLHEQGYQILKADIEQLINN